MVGRKTYSLTQDRTSSTKTSNKNNNSDAVAAAAASVISRRSTPQSSNLSAAAAATALKRHSFNQQSHHALEQFNKSNSLKSNSLGRSNSRLISTSTHRTTNADRSQSLTLKTTRQLGSFVLTTEQTLPLAKPKKQQQEQDKRNNNNKYHRYINSRNSKSLSQKGMLLIAILNLTRFQKKVTRIFNKSTFPHLLLV